MSNFSAQEVLNQLGGRKFMAMTGAKSFTKDENSITFKLPRAKSGIRIVRISLTEMDTYNMEFLTMSGKVVKKVEDVYNDNLQRIFTANTGLQTRLG